MAQVDKAKSYARISYRYPLPPLIKVQLDSFNRLKARGSGIYSMRSLQLNLIMGK